MQPFSGKTSSRATQMETACLSGWYSQINPSCKGDIIEGCAVRCPAAEGWVKMTLGYLVERRAHVCVAWFAHDHVKVEGCILANYGFGQLQAPLVKDVIQKLRHLQHTSAQQSMDRCFNRPCRKATMLSMSSRLVRRSLDRSRRCKPQSTLPCFSCSFV